MHHDEMPMTLPPRYVRATIISTVASAIVPVTLLVLGWLDMSEGTPLTGAEAQGGVVLFVHAVVAAMFVAIAYPLVVWLLFRSQSLSKRRFYRILFVVLIGVSLVPACVLAVVGFGWDAFFLVPASFVLVGLLALPFRPVWFRFAQ